MEGPAPVDRRVLEPATPAILAYVKGRDFNHLHDRPGPPQANLMLARYYSSSLGRFMSPDPGNDTDTEDPQSWNTFAYVRNRPILARDARGEAMVIDSESGGRQFQLLGRLSLDSPTLKAEYAAHACEDCPDLEFGGDVPGLRGGSGELVKALTSGDVDPVTGEYSGSTVQTNPDVGYEVEWVDTLLWEMGKVNYYRTDPLGAYATKDKKKGGDVQSRAFSRKVKAELKAAKRANANQAAQAKREAWKNGTGRIAGGTPNHSIIAGDRPRVLVDGVDTSY